MDLGLRVLEPHLAGRGGSAREPHLGAGEMSVEMVPKSGPALGGRCGAQRWLVWKAGCDDRGLCPLSLGGPRRRGARVKGAQAFLEQTGVGLWVWLGAAAWDLGRGSMMVLALGDPWTSHLQWLLLYVDPNPPKLGSIPQSADGLGVQDCAPGLHRAPGTGGSLGSLTPCPRGSGCSRQGYGALAREL